MDKQVSRCLELVCELHHLLFDTDYYLSERANKGELYELSTEVKTAILALEERITDRF